MQEHVKTQIQTANIDTSANPVIKEVTEEKVAQMAINEMYGFQPKYLHHNLWDEESILSPTTAEWSEMAEPLPHPPLPEILNPTIFWTILIYSKSTLPSKLTSLKSFSKTIPALYS